MRTSTTFTGKEVDPLNMRAGDLCIEDIAHHLACVNRFGGGARYPINVAQHSILVSLLVETDTCSANPPKAGLLHDGSEAYLGDMVKWLKETPEMEAYRTAEQRVQTLIYQTFIKDLYGWQTEVEAADKIAVRLEYELAFGRPSDSPGYGALSKGQTKFVRHTVQKSYLWRPFMTWQESEAAFLQRWRDLHRS